MLDTATTTPAAPRSFLPGRGGPSPRAVRPCGCCGTPEGITKRDCLRPSRNDGRRYGYADPLCLTCVTRIRVAHDRAARKAKVEARKVAKLRMDHTEAETRVEGYIALARLALAKRACDLCGQDPTGRRHDGAEFELEGRICGGCRDELLDERAELRAAELRSIAYRSPDGDYRHARLENRRPGLPVLNPRFTREELTLKAAVALILAETKGVFRRRVSA